MTELSQGHSTNTLTTYNNAVNRQSVSDTSLTPSLWPKCEITEIQDPSSSVDYTNRSVNDRNSRDRTYVHINLESDTGRLKVAAQNTLGGEPIRCIVSFEPTREVCIGKVGRLLSNDNKIEHSINNSSMSTTSDKLKTVYKCTFCTHVFRFNRQLLTHHLQAHKDRLHFACARCKTKFATVANLSEHIPIHGEQKPFKCLKCLTSFTSHPSLRDHKCPSVQVKQRSSVGLDIACRLPTCRLVLNKLDIKDQPDSLADHGLSKNIQSGGINKSQNKVRIQKEFIDVAFSLDFIDQRTSNGVIPDCSEQSAKFTEVFDKSVLPLKHATSGNRRKRKERSPIRALLKVYEIIDDDELFALQKVASKISSPSADSNDVSEHWSPGGQSDDSSNDTAHWFQDSQSANDKNIEIKTEDTSASEQYISTPQVKPFTCAQCDKTFSTNAQLNQHTDVKHKQEGKDLCKSKSVKSKNVGEKPYVCSECNRGFVSGANLKEHQRVIHNGESRYDCKDCDVRFTNAKDSKQHKRMVHKVAGASHSKAREFSCESCTKGFFTSTELKRHFMRKHSDERPYLCPRCGERYAVRSDMQQHVIIHSATRRMFPCEICTNTCTSLAQLKVHIRIHNNERIYACTQCEMKFVSSSHLNRHKRRVHEENRYACSQCERTFPYLGGLTSHKLTHAPTQSYGCSQCDKTFKLNSYLQTHIRTWHNGDRSGLLCTLCGKTFTTKGSLNVHRELHTGERRHACPHCDKRFSKSHDVKIHVRRIHTNERTSVFSRTVWEKSVIQDKYEES